MQRILIKEYTMRECESVENRIKVSVLVAIYNIELFIGKCVRSILDQTYSNLEIILVDDCSTDKSGQICDQYALADNRVQVIHHRKNERLPGVRNTGLDHSTGDYVVFVDGDDWLAPDFVEYMLGLIVKTGADMAVSRNNFTTRDLRQIKEDRITVWSPEKATEEMLYPHITIGAWNKIYRRDFIEQNELRFRNLFTAEGYRFINEAAQRANKVAVGNRKVYYYRLNNVNSATTKPDIRQGTGSLYALDLIEKDLIIKTPSIINALNEHRFLNYRYTVQLIIETNGKKENYSIYKEYINRMRTEGYKVVLHAHPFLHQIKMFLYSFFPLTCIYLSILKKNVGLKMDLKHM